MSLQYKPKTYYAKEYDNRTHIMTSILLSANFGFQKTNKNLILSRIFCKFKSKNGYEQYFNPVIAKKKVLEEMVRQKKYCKETIGKIWIRTPHKTNGVLIRLSQVIITQEDIDRTKRQMYPQLYMRKRQPRRIQMRRPRQNNNNIFYPMLQ